MAMLVSTEGEPVFKPIKGSSQDFALDSRADHTLYHGTRGPGKTITQLMKFRRYVGLGYGSHWRGVIFDREFKNLSDLLAQSQRFFPEFKDGCVFKKSASEYMWVWPTGEALLFRHAKEVSDYENFHGHQYPFIGWNELTKHPTPELYDKMMSTNRSSFVPEIHTPKLIINGKVQTNPDGSPIYNTIDGKPLPPIPLIVFSTTNPSGPGHNWVKRRFINCAANGQVVRREFEVINPKTKKAEVVTRSQVAIFGSYIENTYLDVAYIAELNRLCENNENLYKAWILGDWDFTAGGAFDDLWNKYKHVIPRFPVPKEWYIDRGFDWGSSHPFSVCWFAEANGEEVKLSDGSIFCPPKGSIIQIAEWYGSAQIGDNKGLKMSAYDIAEGIKFKEIELMQKGWLPYQPNPGPADNQIRNTTERDNDTIEKKMLKIGVAWEKSDKSPGSRKNGLQLFRDRLAAVIKNDDEPGFYVMINCAATIDLLPTLPRDEKDPDDVDTTAEDHVWDVIRYRTLKGSHKAATDIKVKQAY